MIECDEVQLVKLLRNKQLIISTIESCTAGMAASLIVSVPGASNVFKQGLITYSNDAKHDLCGVSYDTLKRFTAVSDETAKEMAIGGAKKTKADIVLSVTGVAGPDMEDGKPVGLVYIGCYYNNDSYVKEYHFTGDRNDIRCKAAKEAIRLAIDVVNNNKD